MKTAAALAPIAGASIGFYLPLAVVPLLAGSAQAAGLSTGAFLVATVLFELVTPRIVARLGYRRTLAAGLVLLGLPSLLFLVSDATAALVAANAVRGMGFAIATVAGSALTALIVPSRRRGEGVALVGLVSGAGSLAALPLGLWAAHRYGYTPVFVVTALAPLAALPFLADATVTDKSDNFARPGWRLPVIFAACASAAGVLVTFAPLAMAPALAPVVLLVQPAVTTVARWIAGRVGDRIGQSTLLLPGMVLSVAGMAALAATGSTALVLLGAAAFGAGFGILQNVTLTMMYARVPRSSYSAVSAIWNAAYDLGMAAGALGAGALIPSVGYPVAFLLTAVAMLPTLPLARTGRTNARNSSVTMRALPDMG
ncbi:MFS transporter [Actinoplanes sp. NPDC051513]|uniref:MFS transporter n=1 Tax=Actinoplanes sp. NPDC051513 TaxID=3363908 RepID=UPI0037925478